jgi:hypothetical protein
VEAVGVADIGVEALIAAVVGEAAVGGEDAAQVVWQGAEKMMISPLIPDFFVRHIPLTILELHYRHRLRPQGLA